MQLYYWILSLRSIEMQKIKGEKKILLNIKANWVIFMLCFTFFKNNVMGYPCYGATYHHGSRDSSKTMFVFWFGGNLFGSIAVQKKKNP